jgi:uncharacterized protein YukE
MAEPTLLLVAPSSESVIPEKLNATLGFSQFISPSYLINRLLSLALDFDPLELAEKTVAGDWSAVARAGRALAILGDYCDEVAADLHAGSTGASADWDGQAAEASHANFTRLSTAVQDQADALRAAGQEYLSVSAGMQQTAVLMDSLLRQLMDLAIAAAASAAATAVASSFTAGFAALAGSATVSGYVIRITAVGLEMVKVHDMAVNMCNGSVGLLAGYLGALQGFDSAPLPSSYEHTEVA